MDNKIPSNEDIVNEITHTLENELKTEENPAKSPSDNEVIDKEFEVPTDFEQNEDSVVPDDFIDELALKDQEMTFTDEELETRHKSANDLKNKGNEEFKLGDYVKALNNYTEALRLCPLKYSDDRSILYSNRAACKCYLGKKVSAIDDCTKAIELNDKYVRAYLRRAKLYEETDKLDESLEDYKKILELSPGNKEAIAAQVRLPPLINERNEKLKKEMLGKLKDLGNMFLKPFGLSTENFQLQQDTNSGGYSVNFKQSAK